MRNSLSLALCAYIVLSTVATPPSPSDIGGEDELDSLLPMLAELLFGSTYRGNHYIDEFSTRCVPGTLLHHSTTNSTVAVFTSDGAISISNADLGGSSDNILFRAPQQLDQYYRDQLRFRGVSASSLTNCTSNALDRLPSLHVHLSGGLLVLYPSDFFTHDPRTDTCIPRYIVANEGDDQQMLIVPDNIPQVRVLFGVDEIVLCDDLLVY